MWLAGRPIGQAEQPERSTRCEDLSLKTYIRREAGAYRAFRLPEVSRKDFGHRIKHRMGQCELYLRTHINWTPYGLIRLAYRMLWISASFYATMHFLGKGHKPMACYLCGRSISPGGGYRRWVHVSNSQRLYISRRGIGVSGGRGQGLRTVCAQCAANLEEQSNRAGLIILAIIAVVGIVLYLTPPSDHGPPATVISFPHPPTIPHPPAETPGVH